GNTLAFGDEDGTIRLFDLKRGSDRGVLHDGGELRCLAYSPDGKVLAAAGVNGTITLWDPIARESVLELKASSVQINDLVFSSDGLSLIATGHDGAVHIWRADPVP